MARMLLIPVNIFKQAFCLAVAVESETQGRKGNRSLVGGGTVLAKRSNTCQSMHLGKIQEMKNICKSQFPIELYTIWQHHTR